MFCKTKRGSNRVGQHLERAGVKAAVIHGNKSQGARTRALGDFKAGRVTRAGRHRHRRARSRHRATAAGRQLRPAAGRRRLHPSRRPHRPRRLAGRAVSLVSPADRELLRDIQRLLPSPLEHVVVEGFPVTSSPHDTLPEAGRPRQGGLNRHRSGAPRSGARHGSGGYGRRAAARSGPSGWRPQPHGSAARHR